MIKRLPPALAPVFLLAVTSPLVPALVPQAQPAPSATREILVTSERGERMAAMEDVPFRSGRATGTVIEVFPGDLRQTIEGIGTSFTESSAFVLAHLDPAKRRDVMERIFGAAGANFTLTRTHIGACDFSVEGKYSYDDTPGDRTLRDFSIAPDLAGFDPAKWPGIQDPAYDLLPMIREARAIKRAQPDSTLHLIASAWTAPPWMKDIGTWYIPGSVENNWQGTGGSLKPEHAGTYAEYLVRYLDAYRDAGAVIWGITPVNEPNGTNGSWETMHFTPDSQNAFIRDHLGPLLHRTGHGDVKLLIYDQNRDDLERWTDAIYRDPHTARYVDGAAIHWYESTFKVHEDILDRVHAAYPDMAIVHTEGCIDNLGNDAPGGITDPEGYKESGWFRNDAFWWNPTATDWAYTAEWAGPGAADHPKYTPVHRYARNIIVSLDHWVSGWVDWNIVLDRDGGPNHVSNHCGAPIMIDTAARDVYYTPVFDVLAQFSRTIRPGDRAVRTQRTLGGLDPDAIHACATLNAEGLLSVQVLNTTKEPVQYGLQIGERYAEIPVPANAVQTVRVALRPEGSIPAGGIQEAADGLTAVTLNLWHDQRDWPARRAVILDSLRVLRPDVLLLQEVLEHEGLPNQAYALAESLGCSCVFTSVDPVGGPKRYGNAIVTPHPILATREIRLPPLDDYRVAAYARLDVRGHAVDAYVTHLHHTAEGGAVRAEQIGGLLAFIDSTRAGGAMLLGGDFNAAPERPELAPVRARWTDAFAAMHPGAAGAAATTLNTAYGHTPARIDYLFTDARALRPVAAGIFLDAPTPAGVWASDHFGVWARFAWEE